MTDPTAKPDITAILAVEERGYERLINELRRIRTPRVYTLEQIASKLTPAMGRDYYRAVWGSAPTGHPEESLGQRMLALRVLPRLTAEGVIAPRKEMHEVLFQFTLRLPDRGPHREGWDELVPVYPFDDNGQ